MHGDPDRARLVGDRPRDRLAYPPGRIGRKFETFLIIELLHGLHQAEIAFLNEVEKEHPAPHVPFRDGNDETEVRLGKALFRGFVPLLHAAREVDLFIRRQKRNFADVFQIHLDRVVQPDVAERLFEEFPVALVLVDDLNAGLADRFIDIIDLIGVGIDLFEDIAESVRGNAALLTVFGDDLFEYFVEFLFGYAHLKCLSSAYVKNF